MGVHARGLLDAADHADSAGLGEDEGDDDAVAGSQRPGEVGQRDARALGIEVEAALAGDRDTAHRRSEERRVGKECRL